MRRFPYKEIIEDVGGNANNYTDLEAVFQEAVSKATEGAIYDLRRRSRGGFSYLSLRNMGHPYAKRKPQGLAHLAMINRHDGDLYDGWRVTQRGLNGATITNDTDKAKWVIKGTKGRWTKPKRGKPSRLVGGMYPRGGVGGFIDRVDQDIYRRFQKHLERALRRRAKT